MHEFFQTYKNPLLQSILSISLTALIVFLRIPAFFLYGLHTYIHPENLNNGVRAAIRRPESSDSGHGSNRKPGSELRRRVKSKDKFEFDESNAQIFRLKLDEAHLHSRLYFEDYRNVFALSFVGIASFLLQMYLDCDSSERIGLLESGVFVPVFLGSLGVFKSLLLMVKLSFEKSASRHLEKQLTVLFVVMGEMIGIVTTCFSITSPILDFNLDSVDGFGRLFIIVLMGCLAGLLFVPSTKIARSFWLGTDQIRSSLSMITCGWFARLILYANYLVITFTALLWIKPFSEFLIYKNTNDKKGIHGFGNETRLLGNVGFFPSDFVKLRILCLLLSGTLQLVALRPNLQMYLNEALLSWYQRLHASKVPDLEFSRAKVFLHNHYLCLVVVQFLVSPVLVLTFLGLTQVDGSKFRNYEFMCGLLPCTAFTKEVALFMAWWVNFLLAVYTSATISMFRRSDLYVS